MKITKSQLQEIIKEEILKEAESKTYFWNSYYVGDLPGIFTQYTPEKELYELFDDVKFHKLNISYSKQFERLAKKYRKDVKELKKWY
jgi:hypothetical protein